ncbi:hypothetical protein [Microcoleus sp. Pol10D4]|uniref:hypothetical protein n=1 Tax=Microcoleus sp. Pol10D4 TaxID=3055387 RepID=UPI002FD0493A
MSGRRKKEEGRGKKEEGRRKREEGRGKKEEGKFSESRDTRLLQEVGYLKSKI